MELKAQIENSPIMIVLGALVAGYLAGFGTVNYLDHRDNVLRASIVADLQQKNAQLKQHNATLQISNAQLDKAVRQALIQYVNVATLMKGNPEGGPNSEVHKVAPQIEHLIKAAPQAEVVKIGRDPASWLGARLGIRIGR